MSDETIALPQSLQARLEQGEKLMWWGQPIPKLLAQREINSGLFGGLFFFCFSVFWVVMASSKGGVFGLFGIPFVVVGAWLVSAPIRAYLGAGSQLYALTDRRALLLDGRRVRSKPLDKIAFVENETFADGSGHVLFFEQPPSVNMPSFNAATVIQKSGFLAVPEAERVGRALLNLMSDQGLAKAGRLAGDGAGA